MTFFDFPGIPKGVHGTNEISKTSFRVPTDEALNYWAKRFNRLQVKHTGIKEQFGKKYYLLSTLMNSIISSFPMKQIMVLLQVLRGKRDRFH